MNILTFDSEEHWNRAAADIIASVIRTRPRAVLGLATGGTPVGIYRELVREFRRGALSFRGVTTFNLDEYLGLPADHPETYRSYMKRHLFDHVDLPPGQAHIPDGNAPDPEEECRRYDARLAEAGRIDLQLLGLGHNGHIGFNEPGSALVAGTHVVELSEMTRRMNARFFGRPEDVPKRAITMGIAPILQARTILLCVKGADKAEIVRRALTGPITTECPASLLQTHPRLVVLLDREAGRLLV